MLQVNVGRADRILRIALGLVLIGFALFCPWAASLGPWVTWPSGIVGVVLVVTGATRRCPGYALVGTRTDR
jgi:hypothetical protein